MGRPRKLVILLGAVAAAAAGVAVVRHGRGAAKGREEQGGILIGDAAAYDAMSRLFFGSFFGSIAADVAAVAAAVAPEGARVLEVGCGPGHLSIRLARRHGLDMTGLDLDPAMIERARANADRAGEGGRLPPSAGRRFSSATWPRCLSPTDRSTWSSARCRCTTGPTRRPAWPRSPACCDPAPGRSSGTSGPAMCRCTAICPIRSSTLGALRFAW